jgi:subtilisin family serine protease
MAFASPVLVDLTDDIRIEELQRISYQYNIDNLRWVDPTTADDGLAIGNSDDPNIVTALMSDPATEAAEIPSEFHILSMPAPKNPDPDFDKQWHLTMMDAEWVWSHTNAGNGQIIAVLDTGLTVTQDTNPAQVSPLGKSFMKEPLTDRNGHGTHCASTIAEWTNNGFAGAGLAIKATILPVKVLSDAGSGSSDGIAAGIYYAIDSGADVISMSLGSSQPSTVINKAIDKAIDAGVIVIAAAGNDGCEGCVGFPGGYDPVIGVGALGPDAQRAFYSSYGKGLDIYGPGGNKKIAQGGVWQYTAPGGKEGLYEYQGTSMATPHIAAAVAVLLGEGAPHNQAEMLKIMCGTANKSIFPDKYSCGQANLKAAILSMRSSRLGDTSLPTPNPAGGWTFVILAVSGFFANFVSKNSNFNRRTSTIAIATALLTSGPLYFLTYFGLDLSALSILMVPWLEWPEYILFPGASSFPLWQSFLPMLPLFLVGTPFKFTRAVVIGLCVSAASYLGMNIVAGFNNSFLLPSIATMMLGTLNTLIYVGMTYTAAEFERIRGDSN